MKETYMVIYEPNPPVANSKDIQNYPDLIDFIKRGGVVINNEQTVKEKRAVGLFNGKVKR